MFGKNPKRKIETGEGIELKIQDIFATIQGEGPYTGFPAVFIRVGGCNLACSFCDTEFESFKIMSLQDIISRVKKSIEGINCNLCVITGGEPFRQPIGPLCNKLLEIGLNVQVESNGTLFQEIPKKVEVVCSPKITNGKYYKIREDLEPYIIAYKFLVSKNMEYYNYIPKWDFKNKKVYIQPIDQYNQVENIENMQFAMEITNKTGYILSLQTHKILDIK